MSDPVNYGYLVAYRAHAFPPDRVPPQATIKLLEHLCDAPRFYPIEIPEQS